MHSLLHLQTGQDSRKDFMSCCGGVLILDPERLVKSSIKDNVQIISCLTEQELLQTFMEAYKNYDPTILTGWNIEFFDIHSSSTFRYLCTNLSS